jgi:hypothetical protein
MSERQRRDVAHRVKDQMKAERKAKKRGGAE